MAAYDGYCGTIIHLDHLRHNWALLRKAAGDSPSGGAWPALMAVIKADAYGHGLAQVAKTLAAEGARAFAVGSAREGARLDKALPSLRQSGARILALLGLQNRQDARLTLAHGLVPLLHRPDQIDLLVAQVPAKTTVPVAVKVNTGMSRLGFGQHDIPALLERLRATPCLLPTLLLSHLASADSPEAAAATRAQAALFAEILAAFRAVWPDMAPSLANSPGFLLPRDTLPLPPGNVGRPGFTLYGGNPFSGTSLARLGQDFLPVMEARAPVLELRDIGPGTAVSYGGTFVASRPMRVAVVGAGYSDGVSRSLSGKGVVCIRGTRAPVLGRVCMQMFMVDASPVPGIRVGDHAYILGGQGPEAVTPDELAAAWGTIPYEVFCTLGKANRKYTGR